MLPTHVFADVVGCLHFYALNALMLTNARCSDLARSAATKIRVFDFSVLRFDVYDDEVHAYNLGEAAWVPGSIAHLTFLDGADLVDFIPAALRNYIFGSLKIYFEGHFHAMSEVTHSVVVKGTLYLDADAFANMQTLVEFVASFRSVQKVNVSRFFAFDDSYVEELLNLFDKQGFRQHEYDSAPRKAWVSFVSR